MATYHKYAIVLILMRTIDEVNGLSYFMSTYYKKPFGVILGVSSDVGRGGIFEIRR